MNGGAGTPLNDMKSFDLVSGLWKGTKPPFHVSCVLRSTNFRGDGLFDYGDIAELNVEDRHFSERRLIPGDIVVERSGGGPKQPVGRVALFDPPDGRMYCTSNFTTAIRLKNPNEFDPTFVSLFLHGLYLSGATETLQRATTGIRNLDWTAYRQFEVPQLPIGEQQAIASFISKTRDGYLDEDRTVSVLLDLKRTAMRALFARGLRGESQRDTEIGPVPESWKVCSLSAFFQIKHGFAFDGSRFRSGGDYVLLTPGHFSEQGGFRDQGDKTKYYIGEFDQQYLLKAGDLLVAMTEQKPGLLGSAVILPAGRRYLHNQRLGLIVQLNEDRLTKGFLYHLLNFEPVRAEISLTSTGSKVKHTSPSRIGAVVAQVPPVDEQREIVGILDAFDRKIDLHRRKRTVLDELFKALLHKLMTGEIHVADLDLSALHLKRAAEVAA